MRMDVAPPCGDLRLHVGDTIGDRHGNSVSAAAMTRPQVGALTNRTAVCRSTGRMSGRFTKSTLWTGQAARG